jgi:hypothetical protein
METLRLLRPMAGLRKALLGIVCKLNVAEWKITTKEMTTSAVEWLQTHWKLAVDFIDMICWWKINLYDLLFKSWY